VTREAAIRTSSGPTSFADGPDPSHSGPGPAARGSSGEVEAGGALETSSRHATATEAKTRPARVLIVDDEPPIRTLLRLVLRRDERFDLVGEAVDAEEAITRTADLRPDVILLDLLMPGQHGRDALPALRAAAPDAMILVLSSLSALDEEHETLAAGAFGYLEKSLLGPRLPDVVAEHLTRYAAGPASP
jgi:CheY-like chemotaxis protein